MDIEIENRQRTRTGVFQNAQLRIDGRSGEHSITLRNLSAGGVMAVGDIAVAPGTALAVHLAPLGWLEGHVAWVQDNRFGIAFSTPVDITPVLEHPCGQSVAA